MKVRILVVALMVMAVSALFMSGRQAQADVKPVLAVDSVFAGLNTGDIDASVASFADAAVVENRIHNETYLGRDQIAEMLEVWYSEGRQYDIVHAEMTGDTVTLGVEISDRGIVWGRKNITAVVQDGMIQKLTLINIRLML